MFEFKDAESLALKAAYSLNTKVLDVEATIQTSNFSDFLSADFWQKLCEQIKLPWKTFLEKCVLTKRLQLLMTSMYVCKEVAVAE